MSDDKLLKAVADIARKDAAADQLDSRWDQYSAGTLSDDELENLRNASAARGEPANTEDAFKPLSDEFRQQLANQAKTELNTPTTGTSDNKFVTMLPPPRRLYAPLAMAASLLAVIGLSFFMLRPPGVAPIPGYVAALQGGSEYRSDAQTSGVATYQPGDRLELRLTPATSATGAVGGHVIAVNRDEIFQLDQLKFEFAPSGAARLVGHIGTEIPLTNGEYQLLVVIGRQDALPSNKALRKALANTDSVLGKGWQAWRFNLSVTGT